MEKYELDRIFTDILSANKQRITSMTYYMAPSWSKDQRNDLISEAEIQIYKVILKKGPMPWPYLRVVAKHAMLNYILKEKKYKSILHGDFEEVLRTQPEPVEEIRILGKVFEIADYNIESPLAYTFKIRDEELGQRSDQHKSQYLLMLWELFDNNLKAKEINEMIQSDLLSGALLPENPIEIAQRVKLSRYWNDEEYRNRMRVIWRRNWDKATERHKYLLQNDAEYRKMTLMNLRIAVQTKQKKLREDPVYRSQIISVMRNSIVRAHKKLVELINTDPDFKEHLYETKRTNIAKGRSKRMKHFRNRINILKHILEIEKTDHYSSAFYVADILERSYDTFLRKYYPRVFISSIRNDLRKIRGKKLEKGEMKTIFQQRKNWQSSLNEAKKAASKLKEKNMRPRREALKVYASKRYGTTDLATHIITTDIRSGCEIADLYKMNDIAHSVKRDLEWLKEQK